MYFGWLSSPLRIKGNEKADIATKSALTLPDLEIPFIDFKTCLLPFFIIFGWLVDLGLTALGDSISVYIGPSPKEREKEERKDR